MSTITAIQIKGWQSWLEAYIELLPGINIIHGNSDQGKSAFVRLLKWALMNETRMSVNQFRNWKLKKNSSVFCDVQFGPEEWISREQSRTVNQYQVHNIDDPLEAIRSSVPKEVGSIVKMNFINFQDPKSWFMLDKKPGYIAKEFNKLTNLGILDAAISECNSRIRFQNTELTRLSKVGKDLEEKVERNTGVLQNAEKEFFEEIVQPNVTIQRDTEECNYIFRILQNANEIQHNLKSYERVPIALKEMLTIKDLDDALYDLESDIKKVSDLTAGITYTRLSLDKFKNLDDALQNANEISDIDTQIWDQARVFHQIFDILKMIEKQQQVTERAQRAWQELDHQCGENLKELGYCPLCGKDT